MPLEYIQGDIFESGCDALVNPVNCVGTMGKGLAKEFKRRYPDNYLFYLQAHANGELAPGEPIWLRRESYPNYIINLPTKIHWKHNAMLYHVVHGLNRLRQTIQILELKSIAIPALGCGEGNLDWDIVKANIEIWKSTNTDIIKSTNVLIYEPLK